MWYTPLQAAELNSFPDWPYTPAAVQLLIDPKLHQFTNQVPAYSLQYTGTINSYLGTREFLSVPTDNRILTAASAGRILHTTAGTRLNTFQVTRTYTFLRGA